jgi:hypothetical protein
MIELRCLITTLILATTHFRPSSPLAQNDFIGERICFARNRLKKSSHASPIREYVCLLVAPARQHAPPFPSSFGMEIFIDMLRAFHNGHQARWHGEKQAAAS